MDAYDLLTEGQFSGKQHRQDQELSKDVSGLNIIPVGKGELWSMSCLNRQRGSTFYTVVSVTAYERSILGGEGNSAEKASALSCGSHQSPQLRDGT